MPEQDTAQSIVPVLYSQAELSKAIQDALWSFRQGATDSEQQEEGVDYQALCDRQATEITEAEASIQAARNDIERLTFENQQLAAFFQPFLEEAKAALPEPALDMLNQRTMEEQWAWLMQCNVKLKIKGIKGVPPNPKGSMLHPDHDDQREGRNPSLKLLKGW